MNASLTGLPTTAIDLQPSAQPRTVPFLAAGVWNTSDTSVPVLDKFHLVPCAHVHLPRLDQVDQAVAAARAAFTQWQATPHERGAILDRTAAILEQRGGELIALMQQEVGFTENDARGEWQRSVQTFRLAAEESRRLVGEMVPMEGAPNQTGRLGFTLRVPLGVVCAITPFNAPLNTVAHKIAPALAAGNAVILKPSRQTPSLGNALAQALLDAGLPPGLISVLHGGSEVAHALLDNPLIRFYAFTGSTQVGLAIQQRAGLRRTQMELGSIAFTVVDEDADLERALPKIVNAGFRKAGQVCTSIQILLVHRTRTVEVEQRLGALVRALPYGDPRAAQTFVGPLISVAEAERIERWIAAALAGGARQLAGGPRVGALIPPTLLCDVDARASISCEEVFGPVMAIESFDTLAQALERINATPYGLATGWFTNRLDVALEAARKLEVGGVHINETSSSRVDLMPYGGSKNSGFGREGPHYAIREMSEERIVTFVA